MFRGFKSLDEDLNNKPSKTSMALIDGLFIT